MTGTILWVLFFFGLVYLLNKNGVAGGGCCGGHDHGGGDHERHDLGKAISGDSSYQQVSKDPVCGMTVNREDSYVSKYDHKSYRFCSEQCHKLFDINPGKYIH